MDNTEGLLRHQRRFMEPGKNELQFARIPVDIADREDTGFARFEFLGVDRDQVLMQVQAEFSDRVIELNKVVGGNYQASNDLPTGEWNIEIRALAADGTDWKVRYRSTIREKVTD